MANNKMLIDAAHPEETRVAMVRGNRVDEFDFESEHKTQLRGNIYLAKVTRVEPSLQAAFVDYGGNRHGFLAFSEIHPDYYQIPLADRQALLDADAEDARIQAADEAEEDAQDEADEEAVEEKPARKTRSRRRKKPSNDAEAKSDDDSADSDSQSEKTASQAAPDQGSDAAAEESDDSDDEIGAENDGDDVVSQPAEDAKPKRRTSRPRKAKATEAASDDETVAEDAVEAPKKRTRRKKAEPEASAETSPEADSAEASEEKPKRRTSRKKKTDEEQPAETSAETGAEQEANSEDEPKPAPKKRTRRKKAEPEAEATDEVKAEGASDETVAEEVAEKQKRTRSRRSKKAKEEDAEASPEAEATEEGQNTDSDDATNSDGDEDGAPRRRSRRTRGRGRGRSKKGQDSDRDNDNDDGDDSAGDVDVDVDVVGAGDAMEEVPQRRAPRRHYKIQEVIKRRQILLVQVVKEERGNKGAALTTYLSLAGRYSVLMPNTARGGGISRKITNASDRKRLKAIATGLDVPQGMGVILRTAGASQDSAEVQRDFEYLMRLWENVRTLTLQSTAPCLVYEEGSLIKRSIRDLYDRDTSEIMVAGEAGYREAKDFMTMLMPDQAKNVKLYRDRVPMFAKLGVEAQLDAMLQPQVTLKSGGYLVINQTEALVAIDVNSGRSTRQHSIEETATQTNLEAADEVARQLRLRDLAGLIVIDFIDMEDRRNNRAVEKRLKDALKHDRARIQVGRISHFGLMEMSRQRIRASVLESTTQVCPTCEGVGHVRSSSSVSLGILRLIEEQLNKSSRNNLIVKVTSQSAIYLLNNKREHLSDLENRFGVSIEIEIDTTIGLEPCVIERGEQANRAKLVESAVQPDTIAPEANADDEETVTPVAEAKPASDDNEGSGDGRKRRRRRRRKKSDNGDNSDGGNNDTNADETAAKSDDNASQEAQGKAENAEAAKPEQNETVAENAEPSEAKPPRRRTSRVGKVAPKEQAAPSETSSDKDEKAEKPEKASTEVASEEDARPARRRRTTRRRTEEQEADTSKTDEPVEAKADETSGSDDGDDSPKKEGWWKRRFF